MSAYWQIFKSVLSWPSESSSNKYTYNDSSNRKHSWWSDLGFHIDQRKELEATGRKSKLHAEKMDKKFVIKSLSIWIEHEKKIVLNAGYRSLQALLASEIN